MAQKSALGSILKTKSGSWCCRVTIGYNDGKQVTKSKNVNGTKKQAQEVLNGLIAQYSNIEPAAIDMTLASFIDSVYLPWHDGKYPRKDSSQKLHYTLGRIKSDIGQLELSQITRQRMETYADASPAWKVDKLKAVLRKAAQWDYINKNPLDGYVKSSVTPERKRISIEQLAEILRAFEGNKIEPIVILMSSCGIRKAEALAVNWEDIDFSSGRLKISKTWHYANGSGWIEPPKNNNSSDVVHIPKSALRRLEEIRPHSDGPLCMAPRKGTERMSPNTLSYCWSKVARQILGDEYIPIENLRHTHGSILFDEGMSKSDIGNRLRNTERIAEKYYIADSEILQEKAAGVWDRAIQEELDKEEPRDNVIYLHKAG